MNVVYDVQRDALKIGTQEEILASLRPIVCRGHRCGGCFEEGFGDLFV